MENNEILQAMQQMINQLEVKLTVSMDERDERLLARMDERLDKMDERLDKMDERLDKMDRRLDKMDGRLDKMDERLDKMDEHLKGLDVRLDQAESRMDRLESNLGSRLDQVETLLEHEIPKQLKILAEGHVTLMARLPDVYQVENLTERVTTLERIAKDHTRSIEELKQA